MMLLWQWDYNLWSFDIQWADFVIQQTLVNETFIERSNIEYQGFPQSEELDDNDMSIYVYKHLTGAQNHQKEHSKLCFREWLTDKIVCKGI